MICRKHKREENIEITESSRVAPTIVIRYDDPLAVFVTPSISLELFQYQPTLFESTDSGHKDGIDNNI